MGDIDDHILSCFILTQMPDTIRYISSPAVNEVEDPELSKQ